MVEHEVNASMAAESSAKPAQLSVLLFIIFVSLSIGSALLIGYL
jgi:hypothetical protein